jgi:predicted nucleic acid-binding protein
VTLIDTNVLLDLATDEMLDEAGVTLNEIPREALFLAGKAFRRYWSAGGARSGVLPDFFIGAHAAVLDLPSVVMVTPDADAPG